MSVAPDRDADVLIAGAGPTGLVLAIWLAHLGVRIRIVDRALAAGTTSRALAVQARTLEFYAQLGIAQETVDRGREVSAASLWVKGRRVARAVFGDMGSGISPFPYALVFPQDEHEQLLLTHLATLGVAVERGTALTGFDEVEDGVRGRLTRPDGTLDVCRASYVAGCDGAHSVVREQLQVGFPGGVYSHLFYVADVEGTGPVVNGDVHVGLDRADFLAVFPLRGDGRARLVGTIRPQGDRAPETLSWNDVERRVIAWIGLSVQRVHWFSTYRVHHRVAGRFRQGRAFLLGDAAHIHSPVGGQGMNTGIGDAVNLAWKLAAVLAGHAAPSLLDTYEPERIAFARRLVATTDRGFTAATSTTALARLLRLHVVPVLMPALFRIAAMRRLLFRTVSQTAIDYRGSAISEGRAGKIHGGDRLPWLSPTVASATDDNFVPLRAREWQVHVYGEVAADVRARCAARRLPLFTLPWRPAMRHLGLERDALYLIRPDGYVALADPVASAATLAAYLDARQVTTRPDGGEGAPLRRPTVSSGGR